MAGGSTVIGLALTPCKTPSAIQKSFVSPVQSGPRGLREKSSDHVPAREEASEIARTSKPAQFEKRDSVFTVPQCQYSWACQTELLRRRKPDTDGKTHRHSVPVTDHCRDETRTSRCRCAMGLGGLRRVASSSSGTAVKQQMAGRAPVLEFGRLGETKTALVKESVPLPNLLVNRKR